MLTGTESQTVKMLISFAHKTAVVAKTCSVKVQAKKVLEPVTEQEFATAPGLAPAADPEQEFVTEPEALQTVKEEEENSSSEIKKGDF